ncbi:hypothetical protein MKX01_000429, partial [Papaver californicum]
MLRGMGKFVSQGSYFHTAQPKMHEEREARLRVEAELRSTKERLARVEEQLALVLQTQGGTAATCNSANTQSSSESESISRLEAQLAIFMKNQGAEASINTQHNHSAVSKPFSSAGSSPKIVKDGEEKGVDDEIIQSNRNTIIGKGKSCTLYLESLNSSSIAVAKGKVLPSKPSDLLYNNPTGKGNPRLCLPIPLKGEEEICFLGDAEGYQLS